MEYLKNSNQKVKEKLIPGFVNEITIKYLPFYVFETFSINKEAQEIIMNLSEMHLKNISKIIEYAEIINNVDVLKKFIDNRNDFGFIAKINNKIVGFEFGYILLKTDGRKVFYLDAIDVMPDYQGNGYGTG